jgi:glutamyl-tRNA synthetase
MHVRRPPTVRPLMTVVTRFAPSPTGFLHIGGARTALFCWLFARAKGGKFLLRIEDTDRERSTQEAVDAILDGLSWLGLDPDEPPLFQSTRAERHREVAEELVRRGAAYRCPVSPDELDARRSAAQALKHEKDIAWALSEADASAMDRSREALLRPFRSRWRDPGTPLPEGVPTVVRLRMPSEGDLVVKDHVQGQVKIAARELDDLVILRSDGTPTYMLAVVVDDHDMGVTHVIRGDDHLTNTFRQMPIFAGMGWPIPEYAHVPMIHGQDGKKLSKRHGALGVDGYRDLGYLPEGLRNYLLRLGWSHGDEEIIPEARAIEWFNLEDLNKAPARLDLAKLDAVNAHYMAEADDKRLAAILLSRPELSGLSTQEAARITAAVPVIKRRAANLPAMADAARFLRDIRPIKLADKQARLLEGEARQWLQHILKRLESVSDWTETAIKNALDQYCLDAGVGLGKIGPVLRAVLTGGAPSPDIALVLALLGRNESFARIRDQTDGTN